MNTRTARQAELYARWDREIQGWIRPLVRNADWTPDEREDLLAELKHHTVKALLRTRQEVENLRAFCVTIAVNLIRDRLRERNNRRARTLEESVAARARAEEGRPHQETAQGEAAEARDEIYDLIRRIRYEAVPPEWDAAFSLVFEWRISLRETARLLGQPYSSVEYRIVRTLGKIREKLQELAKNDPELRKKMVTAFGPERAATLLGEEEES